MTTASNTRGKTIADQKALDKDTQAMMFEGVSLSNLSQIFSMDVRKVKAKLHGLQPVKMRAGHPIYSLKEASRYLVEPMWPIDEYIKRMNHADLPMMLRKEFWAGMRSKQIYEMAAGDLWPTDKVIDHISEILKGITMPMKMASDTLEREAGLTPAQRQIVIRIMDDTLAAAHQHLYRIMEERKGADDGGSTIPTDEDDEL